MAGGSSNVVVRFLADVSDMSKGVDSINGKMEGLMKWGKRVGGAIAGAFAVDQIREAISSASELQDAMSASEQIFGNASKQVQDFAGRAAGAFGMSKQQAIDAANTFATFGKGAGLAGDDLAGFATNLTGLAGDLASFRGTTPEQAIQAIGAALRGETEPIRAYGVLLDDATLRNRAMAMGLISTTKDALTPQQKVLAAQAEIFAQTGDAQGDFQRTGDSAANQQKELSANIENTKAALGSALLPVLQMILPVLSAFAKFIQDNAGWLVPLTAAVLGVAAAVWLFNAALDANPIILITIAIAALIAGIILLWQNWDTVWSAIMALVGIVVDAIVTAWQWVADVFISVWDSIMGAFGAARDFIAGVINAIIGFFAGVIGWLVDHWPLILAILTGPFGLAILWITNNWQSILDFFKSIPGLIGQFLSKLGEIIKAPFQWAWDEIVKIKDGIVNVFAGIGDAIGGAFKGAFNFIARVWNNTVGRLSFSIPDWVPGIGGKGFDMPKIPEMAKGGIVTRPTLALLGERGAEAVVPLGAGVGGTTIVVNVTSTGLGVDSPQIQRDVVAVLRGYVTRNGTITGVPMTG